jgi:hypothetical protein
VALYFALSTAGDSALYGSIQAGVVTAGTSSPMQDVAALSTLPGFAPAAGDWTAGLALQQYATQGSAVCGQTLNTPTNVVLTYTSGTNSLPLLLFTSADANISAVRLLGSSVPSVVLQAVTASTVAPVGLTPSDNPATHPNVMPLFLPQAQAGGLAVAATASRPVVGPVATTPPPAAWNPWASCPPCACNDVTTTSSADAAFPAGLPSWWIDSSVGGVPGSSQYVQVCSSSCCASYLQAASAGRVPYDSSGLMIGVIVLAILLAAALGALGYFFDKASGGKVQALGTAEFWSRTFATGTK